MKKFYGFSLVELMVTLIILSCIISAMTPVITKKLQSQGIVVGSGGGGGNVNLEFEQDCSAWEDCALCFSDRCAMCAKTCLDNEYVEVSSCSCKSCDKFENCLECSSIQCKKCEAGYYLEGTTCKICPIGSYCDGLIKTTCEEGKYTDSEGSTTCKTCEVGYVCSDGLKSPCEAGYYTSDMGQSSCKTCEKGYYCAGSSNRNQCNGATYQDNTAQSSCKDCSTNGYYVSDDKTACTVCEAGNMCTSGIKSQCAAGKYSAAGASSCANCSAGYISTTGSSSCTICAAGTYNTTAGSSSCATCPKGYYCTGGTNKTSCGEGKYLATTGNDASSDCKTCASKTANCSKCNLETGVCSECADGYVLDGENCAIPCGDALTMKVTAGGKNLCMMKFNAGDDALNFGITKGGAYALPSTITNVIAGSGTCTPSATTFCCWSGQTVTSCDANNGRYSGCTRTVCDWRAAKEYCSKLTYLGKSWRLPTSNELTSIGAQLSNISFNKGTDGLMLCDSQSSSTSARCTYEVRCPGAETGICSPSFVWSGDVSGSDIYSHCLISGTLWPSYGPFSSAFSVRCVSDL